MAIYPFAKRFTWWPQKGTGEWVQYIFPKPRRITSCEVYWYDDTGKGGCRVPASWKVLYRDGNAWKEVAGASEYGTKKDAFNRVKFDPITATHLRISAMLQPDHSGGILEWRVGE